MRKNVKIQYKKAEKNRKSYYITIPESIMEQLRRLGWKEGKTILKPSIEVKDSETKLVYKN